MPMAGERRGRKAFCSKIRSGILGHSSEDTSGGTESLRNSHTPASLLARAVTITICYFYIFCIFFIHYLYLYQDHLQEDL